MPEEHPSDEPVASSSGTKNTPAGADTKETASEPSVASDLRWWQRRGLRLVPGLAVVIVIAAVATWLGTLAPVVGAPVFGIVLGVIVAAVFRGPSAIGPGAAIAGKRVLQASVVVLGTGLSLRQVLTVGATSLPVMLGTLAVALLGAWLIGKALRVNGDIRTLIGVGTGICGASAIAATTSVIGATEAEVAYAMGTIFTFNIAAVLLFPALGHLMGLSQHAFGLWAGTAINDTSSVVAASTVYGQAAASYGVVVKLTRTLMIIPISLVLAFTTARRQARLQPATMPAVDARPSASAPASASAASASAPASASAASPAPTPDPAAGPAPAAAPAARPRKSTWRSVPWKKVVPLFLVGFLAASALDTLGLIPASWHAPLSTLSTFMITMALTGIGLGTRWATIRTAGHRPLLLGGLLWALVALTSLGLQVLTGTI
ncbi:hypothetical protein GCM10027568_23430 [Humibacter soli]